MNSAIIPAVMDVPVPKIHSVMVRDPVKSAIVPPTKGERVTPTP